ncbi:MAG: ABC transporter permease [Desulfobaccales bacterium]|nr:ABC transporter permease [Desulfobaccales bacterium]
MRLDDLLRVSVRQVLRHRRRYLGVVLAIALGVAGFMLVMTMSRDFKKNFNRDLNLIGGATIIRMYFEDLPDHRPQWFRTETLAGLRRIPGVTDASLVALAGSARTNWRTRQYYFSLLGVDDSFWEVRGLWPLKGQLFHDADVEARKREVVLGTELARRIFGSQEVEGRYMEIDHDLYRVSGLLGGITDSSLANSAFIPLTTAQDRVSGISLPNRLYLRVLTWDDVDRVVAAVPAAVSAHQSADLLRVEVSWEALKRVKHVAWWVEFFIYLALSATLILGGFGIWNVMMAAVRSRTREIGLKKAMGAEDRDILAQFLSEALCLSVGSAILGVALGRLAMEVMGYFIGSSPPLDLFLICLALGLLFAVFLGVGAGLYPSIQASRMEVVSAIRYE